MTNEILVLVYFPFCLASTLLLCLAFVRERRRTAAREYTFLAAMALGWQTSYIAFFVNRNPALAVHLFDLKLPFVAFSAVAMFYFTLRFYSLDRYINKSSVVLTSIVPAITTVMAMTSTHHTYLRETFVITQVRPLYTFVNIRGIWFWVHTSHCYILLLVAAFVVVRRHKVLTRSSRMSSYFFIAGIGITLASNILTVTDLVLPPLDITALSMSFVLAFLYIAYRINYRMNLYVMARNKIFDYMEDAVYIIDENRQLVDANRAALQRMENLEVKNVKSLDDIIESLKRMGATLTGAVDDENSWDIMIPHKSYVYVYHVKETEIVDPGGGVAGMYVTCTDVTRNRMLLQRLDEIAGIDALTGLYNRRNFDFSKYELDIPGNQPVSIVLGDVNGLKTVNDTLGHQQGDCLLCIIAGALEDCCPEDGRLFRLGGDEYAMLLPNCPEQMAQGILEQIQCRLEGITGYPFVPSIALGTATKSDSSQNIDDLFSMADSDMYRRKKMIKASSV